MREFDGAAPAPPPFVSTFAVKAPEDAQVVAPLKYGMPPDVPATVSASVPLVVIGEPPTEIKPPVNDCATLVTVPTWLSVVPQESTPVAAVKLRWFPLASVQFGNASRVGITGMIVFVLSV
jgi:hypothetical protein